MRCVFVEGVATPPQSVEVSWKRSYILRRIAARAITQHPTRHLSSVRPTTRVTSLQACTTKATLYRPFHLSLRWQIDAENRSASPAEAESTNETVTTEPAAGSEDIKEESISTSDVADAAREPRSEQPTSLAQDPVAENNGTTFAPSSQTGVGQETHPARDPEPETLPSSTITEQASHFASAAAQSAQHAASTATQAARETFSSSPRESFGGSRSRPENPPSRILYVGNLFFEVTGPQLEAEFQRYGDIVNSRVVTDSRGLSKGFAYIEFRDQDAADKAVRELDQKVFQGRRMAVQYHVRREPRAGAGRGGYEGGSGARGERSANPPSKTLFIGNMSYQMSDRDLNDLFREIRNVLDVRVAIDRRSGQPRGFAHADFIDVKSAELAKQHLEKKVVYGRQLRVDYSANTSQSERGPGA